MNTEISRRDIIKVGTAVAVAGLADSGAVFGQDANQPAFPAGAFKNGQYTLPELPYAYDALEPLYNANALKIHHTKHHAGYVKGLNGTLEKLEASRKLGDYGSVKALLRDLAFNGSGHILHCLFWNSMTPKGSEVPPGLDKAIVASFGSVDAAKAEFVAATKAVEGSGWGVLAYEPAADKLLILQAEKHQNLTVWGVMPLLVCDVWEHAYYLQYASDRGQWVDNFMKLANWKFAAECLAKMRR